MPEERIPTAPMSPLQLLTLPLDVFRQAQFQVSLATIRAMGGNSGEAATAEAVREEPAPGKVVKPDRLFNRTNITINRSEKIIDEDVPGHIDEVMVKSVSAFSIELLVDDHPVFHESMTDLIDISSNIVSISAIYSGGYYMFSITDLTYNRLFLRVFLEGSGTFNIFRKLRRDPDGD